MRQMEQDLLMKKAHQKALEVFEETNEIDPRSFTDFDQNMVAEDLKYVERLNETFRVRDTKEGERMKMYATAFEGLIYEQTELNDWLGPNVLTTKASTFDDYKHGVDSIASFPDKDGKSHAALALDVTFTEPRKKLERIRKEIENGTLSDVKYFRSPDDSYVGSLSLVPRVVIGADKQHIIQVSELWAENKQKKLAEDPLQIQLLEEILMQLKAFQAYARKQNVPERNEMVETYGRMISLVTAAFSSEEKQRLRRTLPTIAALHKDKFFTSLPEELEAVFGSDYIRKPTKRTGVESLAA